MTNAFGTAIETRNHRMDRTITPRSPMAETLARGIRKIEYGGGGLLFGVAKNYGQYELKFIENMGFAITFLGKEWRRKDVNLFYAADPEEIRQVMAEIKLPHSPETIMGWVKEFVTDIHEATRKDEKIADFVDAHPEVFGARKRDAQPQP